MFPVTGIVRDCVSPLDTMIISVLMTPQTELASDFGENILSYGQNK